MKLTLTMALLLPLLLTMACQPVMPTEDAGEAQLAGTTWLLTDLGGETAPPEVTVTAMFGDDGTLSGSSGCNNYSTSYEVDGQSIAISPQIMSTMMMCPEPVMQVEMAYQQALASAASYEVSGDTLILKDESGAALMTFSAQSQELAGTFWKVISYNNGKQAVVSVMVGTEITANFEEDGTIGGSAGCNDYSGAYMTDGDQISIGPLAATLRMCVDDAVMEQEAQYLTALESAATFRLEGSKLQLRTADGAMAVNMQAAE